MRIAWVGHRLVLRLVVAASVLSVVSCAPRRDDRDVSRAAGALAINLSTGFDIEGVAAYGTPTTTRSPSRDLACTAQSCLLLYAQTLAFTTPRTFAYGARVDSQGALLDLPRIYYGEAGSITGLIARANDYLAFLAVPGASAPRVARLNGTTGGFIQNVAWTLPTGSNYRVRRGDTTILLVYQNAGTDYAQVYDLETLAPVGTAPALPMASPDIAAGGGVFLLSWSQLASRVSEATGALLDAQPIVFSQYYPGTPHAAFVGGTFVLAWEHTGNVMACGLRASDAMVLNRDTELCDNCFSNGCSGLQIPQMSTVRVGAYAVVSWPTTAAGTTANCLYGAGIHGLRVDPATGQTAAESARPILRSTRRSNTWFASLPAGRCISSIRCSCGR